MDHVEWVMVAIHFIATGYVFLCHTPPQIGIALRQATSPFQIRARGRTAAAERSAVAWHESKVQSARASS
jgi:hypothetical protein